MKNSFKLLLFVLLLAPMICTSQKDFRSEEFAYIHRHADSSNEASYVGSVFDSVWTRWGSDLAVDSTRKYADSIYIYLDAQIDSGYYTIYSQYGYVETAKPAGILWCVSVAHKLADVLYQYAVTPVNRRSVYRQQFVTFASGHVYIRYYK